MSKKIIIIGAGGHGKVVYETIVQTGHYTVAGFADSGLPVGETVTGELKVLCKPEEISAELADFFVVAIGNNVIRQRWFEATTTIIPAVSIIHPAATVSPTALINAGTVILAGAVVNAGVVIGENSIINAMALVDHDSTIGKHSHIRQGTIIASNCKLSAGITTSLGQLIDTASNL